MDVSQAQIFDMRFTTEGMKGISVTFPGGAKLGMNGDKFSGLYEDLPNFFDTESDEKREISGYIYTNTGKIIVEAILCPSESEEGVYTIDEFYMVVCTSDICGKIEV